MVTADHLWLFHTHVGDFDRIFMLMFKHSSGHVEENILDISHGTHI